MSDSIDTYDVAVVGSGGAGCSAAIESSVHAGRVALLTRGDFFDSKTARAQGGIQVPMASGDSEAKLYADTVKAGENASVPELTRALAAGAKDAFDWLVSIGIEFDKEDDGSYLQRGAAGLSAPRIVSCGDASGNRIMRPLSNAVGCRENISVLEYCAVARVERSEASKLLRIEAFDPRSGACVEILAKSVVLATGGAMPREKRAGLEQAERLAPDSIAIAKATGLPVENPELTQFHPTGILQPKALRRKPVPELLRSMGATLLNQHGQEFTDSLMTRKKLCDAIVEECEQGNGVTTEDGRVGVWLDTTRVDDVNGSGYCKKHFPTLYREMLAEGHDITKAPVLVYPIAHYTIGGIRITATCETEISGLFAAGEATWGVHGNDRLMGNSLLEVFVFGRIAGRAAAEHARHNFGDEFE